MNNLPKSWRLEISSIVLKYLDRVPKDDAEKITAVIISLRENPYYGDIKKMKGRANSWRRRVGSYRLFYKIQTIEKIILVFDIERRASHTY